MGFPFQVSDNEAEMDWNKDHIRETMLSLETAALKSAREKYLDYVCLLYTSDAADER